MLKLLFLLSIFFILPGKCSFDFYILQNFTATIKGLGTITQPYNNIFQAFQNVTTNTSLVAALQTAADKRVFFVLMSDYYILKADDFTGITTFKVLNTINVPITVLPKFCFDNYKNTTSDCPSNTTVEIQYKYEFMRMEVNVSIKLVNIRITGRDLLFTYNASLDSGCYFTREGCCPDDADFMIGTNISRCQIQNKTVNRNEITISSYPLIDFVAANGSLILVNFELSYFHSIKTTTPNMYTLFIYDSSSYLNLTITIQNATFFRMFLKLGLIYMILNKNSSYSFSNVSIIDYNYFQILEYSTSSVGIYAQKSLITLYSSNLSLPSIVSFNQGRFINSTHIFRMNNVNFSLSNCVYGAVTRFYTSKIFSVDGFFIGFQSSTNSFLYAELSNFTFTNLTFFDVYFSGISAIAASSQYFMNLRWNVSITNMTFSNITLLRLVGGNSYGFLIRVSTNSILSLANCSINLINLNSAMIVFETNISALVKNLTFANVYGNGQGGIFNMGTMSSLSVMNCSFENWTISGYSNYLDNSENSLIIFYGKGGVFYLGVSDNLTVFGSNFTNGALPTGEGGIVYSLAGAHVLLSSCRFRNISANYSGTIMNIQNDVTNITILNCRFKEINGNAFLHLNWVNVFIENSRFSDSSYTNKSVEGFFYFFINNTLTMQNSGFKNMSFNGSGGVIFCIHYNQINLTNMTFSNFNVSQKYAILYGQGNDVVTVTNCTHDIFSVPYNLYFLSFQGNLSIINSSFTNIFMSGIFNMFGGAFFVGESSVIHLQNAYIENMTVQTFVSGGLIYLDKSNLLVDNLTVNSFQCGSFGGLIYVSTFSVIAIANVFLTDITSQSGVLIYMDLLNNGSIQNVSGNNLTSSMDGGVFYMNSENILNLSQMVFSNVGCQRYGGFLMSNQKNLITILNVQITNSSAGNFGPKSDASGEGGLFYLKQLNGLNMQGFSSENTMSEREGGSFSFFGGLNNISVFASSFNLSKAVSGNGGFLSFSGTSGNNFLTFSEVFVFSCFANNSGGFISVDNSFNVMIITNSFFFNSQAKYEYGGGMNLENGNQLTMFNVTVSKVKCNLQGGFIYSDLNNQILISLCTVINATSETANGGLFNLEQSNNLSIVSSNFSLVSSYFDGGGFYLYNNNTMTMVLCQIITAVSRNRGGFVSAFKANLINVSQSLIVNASSTIQGCLAYLFESNRFILYNSNITLMTPNPLSSLVETVFTTNVSLKNSSFYLKYVLSVIILNGNSRASVKTSRFHKNSTCTTVFNIYSSNLTLTQIIFNMNVTNYFSTAQNSIMTIKACNFMTIDAANSAFLTFSNTLVTINKCKFTKISKMAYGMMYAENCNVSFRDSIAFSIFSNYSGAVFSLKNSNFTSHKNFFLSNKVMNSGGTFFFAFDQNIANNVTVISSMFFVNTAKTSGGGIYFQNTDKNNKQVIRVGQSMFFSNLAPRGGGICIENAGNFTLKFCNFKKNAAKLNPLNSMDAGARAKGGAIYSANSPQYKISNNFTENIAQIGGASFTEGSDLPKLLDNTYIQNEADFYGKDDSTDVKTISFYRSMEQYSTIRSLNINNIQSGKYYQDCLANITGFDAYNNVAFNTNEDYSAWIQINQTTNLKLNNLFSFTMTTGFLCFNGYFKRYQLPIESSFTYGIVFKNQTDQTLSLNLNFRDCQVGERLTDDRACDPCPLNTYSFVTDFTLGTTEKCHTCDETTNFYCFGTNHLTSKKDFWRLNEFSTNFLRCKNSACLGDPRMPSLLSIISGNITYDATYATSLCEVGYTGILCNECANNYGHIDSINCLECGSSTYNFNVIFQLILRVLFTVYSVFQEYIMVCSICSSKIDQNEVITTNILKIFANHMQVLTIIRAFPFQWPNEFSFTAGIFLSLTPNVSEGLSLECILKGSYFNINSQYFKLIICFVYPFILSFLSLIFIQVVQSIKKDKMTFWVARSKTIQAKKRSSTLSPMTKGSKLKDSSISFENLDKLIHYNWVITSIFFCILILCFPDIIKVILSMFACSNFGDNKNIDYRLVSDYTVKCDLKTHMLWTYFFAVPFLFLIGILFPIYLFLSMCWAYYKNRMQERDRETLLKYGFFYYAYKSHLFFWDLLILIRKMLLLFINIFLMTQVDINKDLTPILLVFIIMVISVLLQYHFAPFNEEKFNIVNNVESVSLSTLVMTILATLFYFGETSVGRTIDFKVVFFLILVTVISNIFFLAYFVNAFYLHNIKVKLIMAKKKSEMLFSKIKMSSMWTTFVNKFSSSKVSSPNQSPPLKVNKSKSRPVSLFKSNHDANLKKELFSPLKKRSTEEKMEQKKILFVLTEILLQRGKEDMERHNLLMLEQERIKEHLIELKKQKKPSEIDLGDEIPEERLTTDQEKDGLQKASGFIHKIYNNTFYYNLACLSQESNQLTLNSVFSAKSKCKLKNPKTNDFYLKIVVEFNFKEEIGDFSCEEPNEGNEYAIIIEETKPKENTPLLKILKIYLKVPCIPLSSPQLIVITKKDKKEIRYDMKLPCTLNKFFLYEILLSEEVFKDNWKSQLHLSKKMRIDASIANSLEKLTNIFPHSQIFEFETVKKDEDDLKERWLCGKFKLIFYEDFDYHYKISFNEKNTYIKMELSYPEKEIFDPRQKFIGEVILDNYKKLFGPVN